MQSDAEEYLVLGMIKDLWILQDLAPVQVLEVCKVNATGPAWRALRMCCTHASPE